MVPTSPLPAEIWASTLVLAVGVVPFLMFAPTASGFALLVLVQLAVYWSVRLSRQHRGRRGP